MGWLVFSPATGSDPGTRSTVSEEDATTTAYSEWSTLSDDIVNGDTVVFMDETYNCNTTAPGIGEITLPEHTSVTYTRATALSSNPVLDGDPSKTGATLPNNIINATGNLDNCKIEKLTVANALHNGINVEANSATGYSNGFKVWDCVSSNNGRTLADPTHLQGNGIVFHMGLNWASGPAPTAITGAQVLRCTTQNNASAGVMLDGPYKQALINACTSTNDGRGSDGAGANTKSWGLILRPTGGAVTTYARTRTTVQLTTLNGAHSENDTALTVAAVGVAQKHDCIAIALTSGEWHWTYISSISDPTINIAEGLGGAAGNGLNVMCFSTVYSQQAFNYDYRAMKRCSMSNGTFAGLSSAASDCQYVFSEDTTDPTTPAPGKFGSVAAAAQLNYINLGVLFNDNAAIPVRMTGMWDGDNEDSVISNSTALGHMSEDGHGIGADQHTKSPIITNCTSNRNMGNGFNFHITQGGTLTNCQASGNKGYDVRADKMKSDVTWNLRDGPTVTAEKL